MPFAWKPARNPVPVVGSKKLLVRGNAGTIGPRITPAVQQIAPLPRAAAAMAGCFGRGRAVIDDPDFAERMDAHHELIEFGVKGDSVEVGPIRVDARRLPEILLPT